MKNKAKSILTVALAATALSLPAIQGAPAEAQTARSISIRDVRTVYHRSARGNEYFTARLRAELAQQGIRFANSPRQADAILDTQGQYNGRAFIGKMTVFDLRGRVIYSENVYRPDNSRTMAYQRLADKFRARRR